MIKLYNQVEFEYKIETFNNGKHLKHSQKGCCPMNSYQVLKLF